MFSKETLITLLNDLTGQQESIEKVSVWLQQYKDEAAKIVPVWRDVYMESSKEKKLTLLYLVNDVVQHSKRKGPHFVEAFSHVLPKCMAGCKNHESKSQIERMLDIWESRGIFSKDVVSAMKYNLDEFGMEDTFVKLSDLMKTLDELRSLESKSSEVLTKLSIRLDTTDFANAFNVTSRKEGDKYAGDFDETANFLEEYCACLSKQTLKRNTMLRKINSTLYQMEKLEESVKKIDQETKNKQAQLVRTRKAITSRLMMIDEGMVNFGDDSPDREEIENLTSEEEDVDIEGIETVETHKNGKDDKLDKLKNNGDDVNTTFEDDGIHPEDAVDEQKPRPKEVPRQKRQVKRLPSYDPRQILSYGFRLDGPPNDEQSVGFMLLPDGTLCAVPIAPHMFLQKPKPPSPKEEGEIEAVAEAEVQVEAEVEAEVEGPKTPEEEIIDKPEDTAPGPKTPSEAEEEDDVELEEGEVSDSDDEDKAEAEVKDNVSVLTYDEVDGVPLDGHFDITEDGYASDEHGDHDAAVSSPGSAPSMPSPEVSDEEDPQVKAMRNVSTWQENYNMPGDVDGESLGGEVEQMELASDPEEGEISEDEQKAGMTGVAAFLGTFDEETKEEEDKSEYEQFYPPGYLKEQNTPPPPITNMKPAYLMGTNVASTNRQPTTNVISSNRQPSIDRPSIDRPSHDQHENTPPPINKPLYLSGSKPGKPPYTGPTGGAAPHPSCPPYNGMNRYRSNSSDTSNHYKDPPDEYDLLRYPEYSHTRPNPDYPPSPRDHPRRPLPPQDYYQNARPRPYLTSPPPRQSYPPPSSFSRRSPPPLRQPYPPPGAVSRRSPPPYGPMSRRSPPPRQSYPPVSQYGPRPRYMGKQHLYREGHPDPEHQRYPPHDQDHFLELGPRSKQPETVGSGGIIRHCTILIICWCGIYYAVLVSYLTVLIKKILTCKHQRRKVITIFYKNKKYCDNPVYGLSLGDSLSLKMNTEITVYMMNGQNRFMARPPFPQSQQNEQPPFGGQRLPFGNLPNFPSQPPPFSTQPPGGPPPFNSLPPPQFTQPPPFTSFPPPFNNETPPQSRTKVQTYPNQLPQFPSQPPPFAGQASPFGGKPPPFADQAPPFGGKPPPFADQALPFGGKPPPFADQAPPFGGKPPPFADQAPPFGGKPPSFPDQPPPFGSKQSPFGDQLSPFGGKPPSFPDQPLPFGNKPPPFTDQSPPFSDPPFGNMVRPRTGKRQSRFEDKAPPFDDDGIPYEKTSDHQQTHSNSERPEPPKIQKYGPPMPSKFKSNMNDFEEPIPTQTYGIQKYGPAIPSMPAAPKPATKVSKFGPPLPQKREVVNKYANTESESESESDSSSDGEAENNFQIAVQKYNRIPAVQRYNTNYNKVPQRPVEESDNEDDMMSESDQEYNVSESKSDHRDDMSESSDGSDMDDSEAEEPFGDIPKPKVNFYKKEEKKKEPSRIAASKVKDPKIKDVEHFSPFDEMLLDRQKKFKPLRKATSEDEPIKFSSFPEEIKAATPPFASPPKEPSPALGKDMTSIERILELYDLEPCEETDEEKEIDPASKSILQDVFGGEMRRAPHYRPLQLSPPPHKRKVSPSIFVRKPTKNKKNNNNQQPQQGGGNKKKKRRKGAASKNNNQNNNNKKDKKDKQDTPPPTKKSDFTTGIFTTALQNAKPTPPIPPSSSTTPLPSSSTTLPAPSTTTTPSSSTIPVETKKAFPANSLDLEKEKQRQEVLQKIALMKQQNEQEKEEIKAHMKNWKEGKVHKEQIGKEKVADRNKDAVDKALNLFEQRRAGEEVPSINSNNQVSTGLPHNLVLPSTSVPFPALPLSAPGDGATLSALSPFFQQAVLGNAPLNQTNPSFPVPEFGEPAPPGFETLPPPIHTRPQRYPSPRMRAQRPPLMQQPPGMQFNQSMQFPPGMGFPPGGMPHHGMPHQGMHNQGMHNQGMPPDMFGGPQMFQQMTMRGMGRGFYPHNQPPFQPPRHIMNNFNKPPVTEYQSTPSFISAPPSTNTSRFPQSNKNPLPTVTRTISGKLNPPVTVGKIVQKPKIDPEKMKKALELKAKIDQSCFKKKGPSRFDITPADLQKMKEQAQPAEEAPTPTRSRTKPPEQQTPAVDLDDIENLVDHNAGDLGDFEF